MTQYPYSPAVVHTRIDPRDPAATALREALRDSTSPSRVYLPREVARPAKSIDDFEKAFGATHTDVEPTVEPLDRTASRVRKQ